MKTKTKLQSKILIAFAISLCCFVSVNSFGQNSFVPTKQDFHGTWVGATPTGNTIELKLNSNSSCEFKVNGAPVHLDNPVTAYRLPQYNPKTIAESGPPSAPEIFIKFYTRDALNGIRAAVPNTNANSSTVTDNSVEQVYSGIAVLSLNSSTNRYDMALYLDIDNFSSVSPDVTGTDAAAPYCILSLQ